MSTVTPENKELTAVNNRIHAGLKGVECRHDGSRLNIFTGRVGLEGYGIGISLSIYPDSTIDYHVSKDRPKDFDGYKEVWEYHWGRTAPNVIHSRTHESRLHLSSVHPDDTHELRPMDRDDIRLINILLDDFERST